MNLEQVLFLLFALGACGGAVAVVISQNVARMAFWLVVSLGSTAGLFFQLHADLVGATQLLIYVGGTVVLLIFGVMLTATGPFLRITAPPGHLFRAGFIGLAVMMMVAGTVAAVDWETASARVQRAEQPVAIFESGYNPPEQGNTARPLGLKLLGISIEDLDSRSGTLSSGYLLPFEVASVHLLVVLIAAAYLARAKRRIGRSNE